MVNSPSVPPNSTPTSGPVYKHTGPSRLYPKQKEVRAGPDSGSPVSQNLFTSGLRGSFPSRVQNLGDSFTRIPSILPPITDLFSSVPAYGVTQLGLRSYPSGSFVPENPSTSFSFIRSDKPVNANALIRPTGPCQPSTALAGSTFPYLRNPYPHVSGGFRDFYRCLHAGVWRSDGGFPDFGYLDPYRPQAPYQLSGAQGGSLCPTALGPSAPGPPGYDRYRQFDSSFVYQQARRDPFPHLVTFDSRASPLVRGSEHNSPSKAYSRLSEHYQTTYLVRISQYRQSGPSTPKIVKCIFRLWLTPEVDMFATVSNSHLSRFMSPILEPRVLAVHALPQDWQGRSVYMFPPFSLLNKVIQKLWSTQAAEVILVAPWWPKQSWFSAPTSSLRGSPLCAFPTVEIFVPAGSEVCLGGKVVPSARMEALMRHYKAAGFSDEVSRLAASPKRPSTNRMYDDRWLGFAPWAAGQGFDPLDPTAAQIAPFLFTLFDNHGLSPQTVKGYRTCLGSVLAELAKPKWLCTRPSLI